MAALHKLFSQAPELGSLVDPGSVGRDLFSADFKSVARLLDIAIERERGIEGRDERAVAAAGMARAAEILQGRYTLVVTNVPFLGQKKHASRLAKFSEKHHGDAKGDLATVFVSRIFGWLGEGGTQAVVSPQNWLFLKTYGKLRVRLLKGRTWNLNREVRYESLRYADVGLQCDAEHPIGWSPGGGSGDGGGGRVVSVGAAPHQGGREGGAAAGGGGGRGGGAVGAAAGIRTLPLSLRECTVSRR